MDTTAAAGNILSGSTTQRGKIRENDTDWGKQSNEQWVKL
jgi:hypothetical protein